MARRNSATSRPRQPSPPLSKAFHYANLEKVQSQNASPEPMEAHRFWVVAFGPYSYQPWGELSLSCGRFNIKLEAPFAGNKGTCPPKELLPLRKMREAACRSEPTTACVEPAMCCQGTSEPSRLLGGLHSSSLVPARSENRRRKTHAPRQKVGHLAAELGENGARHPRRNCKPVRGALHAELRAGPCSP